MKKWITVFLALVMAITVTACSKSEKNIDLCGTWKVDCIEYDGAKFSVEEWRIAEDEDLSSFYIVFKDGGKAYIYEDGYGELVNWLKSEDSVMIDGEICSMVDEMICLDYYGDKLFLKKTSDSQEIPKEDEAEDNAEDEELSDEDDFSVDDTASSETNNSSSGDDEEWRQFLKDYEEWVDSYIEIIKKYKENPYDMSILSDYTEMVSEMADWTERADEIEQELDSTGASLEYSAELLRIAGKLAEAVY